jgi:hypothetical protein
MRRREFITATAARRSGIKMEGCPRIWKDIAMRFLSRFISSLAVSILSIALPLCGPGGTAMSQTATPSGATSLPKITVQAPKPVARPQKPQQRAVVRNTVRNTVSPGASPSPTTPALTVAQESVLAKLARLERASGSCVGGCQTSFPSGNRPYVGCSSSGWPAYSPPGTCKNPRNYKSYVECTQTSHFLGWRPMEYHWYCTSLAFKK